MPQRTRSTAPTTARGPRPTVPMRTLNYLWPILWLAWLPFLAYPVAGVLRAHPPLTIIVALLTTTALFTATFVWSAWTVTREDLSPYDLEDPDAPSRPLPVPRWLPPAVLTAIAIALTLTSDPRWLFLLIYAGASVGIFLPAGKGGIGVAAVTLLTLLTGWWAHSSGLAQVTLQVLGSGGAVLALIWVIATTRALHAAREENARLAVETERLRIARDLHDVLGHDLTQIALKSELAEYLVNPSPDQAKEAMRDIGGLARAALQQARSAVAGYRKPTLAGELRGAREILAAAGIACTTDAASETLPPDVENVSAWTVREGITNVVKHSRARHCTIRIARAPRSVTVEITDDGTGAPPDDRSAPSHGLVGLSERVTALHGRCTSGPRDDGPGFRLTVTLPLTARPSADPATSRAAEGISPKGGRR